MLDILQLQKINQFIFTIFTLVTNLNKFNIYFNKKEDIIKC